MEKILTISIAAYNVEKYIRRTLDSLIDESIINDLEIFVVDDGGKDSTLQIAQEYAARYPQSIFPIHKENGGYGSTVNYSIAHATGKYFKILDGDDWYDLDGLVHLLRDLHKYDSDMFLAPFYRVYEKNGKRVIIDSIPKMASGEYKMDYTLDISSAIKMHNITYRTKILRDANLKITEHCFYTDMEYALFPLSFVKQVHISHIPIYCYRIGVAEQSVGLSGIRKHIRDHEIVLKHLGEWYAEAEKLEMKCKNVAYQVLCRTCGDHFHFLCLLKLNSENKAKLQEYDRNLQANPRLYKDIEKQGRAIKYLRKTKFWTYYLFGWRKQIAKKLR